MIGEIVGEYKIVSQLAPGVAGDVFVGEHKDLGTKAAVEVLHPKISASVEGTQKYLHTVRMVSKIKHGGTMKIEDCGLDSNGRAFVVMELLDGDTLAKRIEGSGRLSLTQIGEIGRQLSLVLAALHDEGLVHGDLRPEVVFLMKQGGLARGEPLKLTEFGIADLKRKVGIEIAPTYTAPELLGSGEPIDWRVDAYGLGCVLYEMATGKVPFAGADAEEVRTKHRAAAPPAPRALMPDVPPALDQLIGRLMSKLPEDRYGSMREIARELEQFGGGREAPLAPTAEQPALKLAEVAGELKPVAAGELKAKEPTKEPEMVETASIQIEGPEAEQAVNIEAPQISVLTGGSDIAASRFVGRRELIPNRQARKTGSKLPIVIVAGVVVAAVIVMVVAMR